MRTKGFVNVEKRVSGSGVGDTDGRPAARTRTTAASTS